MPLKAHTSTDGESKAQENDVEGGLIESEWNTLYQWHFLHLSTINIFYIPRKHPDSEEGKIMRFFDGIIAYLLSFFCFSIHWLQRKYTGSTIKLVWVVNGAIVHCNADSQLLKVSLEVNMIHSF